MAFEAVFDALATRREKKNVEGKKRPSLDVVSIVVECILPLITSNIYPDDFRYLNMWYKQRDND